MEIQMGRSDRSLAGNSLVSQVWRLDVLLPSILKI